jgi:hypothetical protein
LIGMSCAFPASSFSQPAARPAGTATGPGVPQGAHAPYLFQKIFEIDRRFWNWSSAPLSPVPITATLTPAQWIGTNGTSTVHYWNTTGYYWSLWSSAFTTLWSPVVNNWLTLEYHWTDWYCLETPLGNFNLHVPLSPKSEWKKYW